MENGLTYYVRSNGAPGGNLELRLVVAAGSLEQEVARSGVAHFVEHMLFNGTVGFPGNTLTQTLEGFGMQVGADVNAYTTCEATVYSLSVALDGADSAATAFDVLDQWASAATIASKLGSRMVSQNTLTPSGASSRRRSASFSVL